MAGIRVTKYLYNTYIGFVSPWNPLNWGFGAKYVKLPMDGTLLNILAPESSLSAFCVASTRDSTASILTILGKHKLTKWQ